MSNDEKGGNKKYDIEERTAKFGEDIIVFAKKVPVFTSIIKKAKIKLEK